MTGIQVGGVPVPLARTPRWRIYKSPPFIGHTWRVWYRSGNRHWLMAFGSFEEARLFVVRHHDNSDMPMF